MNKMFLVGLMCISFVTHCGEQNGTVTSYNPQRLKEKAHVARLTYSANNQPFITTGKRQKPIFLQIGDQFKALENPDILENHPFSLGVEIQGEINQFNVTLLNIDGKKRILQCNRGTAKSKVKIFRETEFSQLTAAKRNSSEGLKGCIIKMADGKDGYKNNGIWLQGGTQFIPVWLFDEIDKELLQKEMERLKDGGNGKNLIAIIHPDAQDTADKIILRIDGIEDYRENEQDNRKSGLPKTQEVKLDNLENLIGKLKRNPTDLKKSENEKQSLNFFSALWKNSPRWLIGSGAFVVVLALGAWWKWKSASV